MSGSRSRKLREKLHRALRRERLGEALGYYEALEALEPTEPRWPHRKGDLLKRLGRLEEAITTYERAVDLYAHHGFVARAAAMAKVVMGIAPDRIDVLDRVNADTARRLHRSTRSHVVTADTDNAPELDEVTQTKRISRNAFPLVPESSEAGEQSTFSRPPAARHLVLELDISDAELEDPRPVLDVDERPTPERLAQLPSMPLFAEVPKPVLDRMVREARLIDLDPGQNLIQRGTTADALFVLVEGSVQLVRALDEDAIVLSEGDVVGISCLLERVSYEGDVTARTKVRALRISKLLLDRLVEEHPALGDILLEVLGRRLVAILVRTSPMFASFENEARSEVAGMFEVRRAYEGTAVLEAGKRADGLYIPMIGQLAAIGPDGTEVGKLKLGRALGQHSMLTRTPSPLTVRAESDVLVLRMSARRFRALVSEHPKLVSYLEDLASRPSEPKFSLLPEPRRESNG